MNTAPLQFRFIFKRLFSSFCLIYLIIFSAYFIFDFLIHIKFSLNLELFTFIWNFFIQKFDFFCSLSSLFAILYTISSLKQNNEILALLTNGIQKITIIKPFIFFSLLMAFLTLVNSELILPYTNTEPKTIKQSNVYINHLDDGSRIAYHLIDNQISDLYWIKLNREIWHCQKVLKINDKWIGKNVDALKKSVTGALEKFDSFDEYLLPLPASIITDKPNIQLDENRSISNLISLLINDSKRISSDKNHLYTLLYQKITTPWITFILMGIFLPYLFPFSRKFQPFYLYALGLLVFLLFQSTTKTVSILAENYMISPFLGLLLLPSCLQGALIYRLCKI